MQRHLRAWLLGSFTLFACGPAAPVTPAAAPQASTSPDVAQRREAVPAAGPTANASTTAEEPMHACGIDPDGDDVERGILERPTPLKKGVGKVTQKVTTTSREAQAFYDQGLAFLHSYVWIEAARSFHEALRRDPKLAMAEVGIARAELGLSQKRHAREAIARARALASGASARERVLIELRAQQIEGTLALLPEQRALHEKYKAALDKAIAEDPSDAETWIQRGNAEEALIAGRGQRGEVGAIAYYEAALRRSPDHFGAHHYLVHSYENVGRPEEAIAHGRIYAAAAPGVAHAQHMLAHVLPRVGKWTEALEQFQKADRIEEEYAKEEKLRPGDDWHHAHNLDLLGYTQLRLGRIDEAEKTFRRRWEVPAHTPLFVGFNTSWPEFLLLRGRFDEALAAASVLAGSPTPSGRTAGFALSAEALLALGRVPEAKAAIKRAEEAVAEGGRPKTTGGVLFGQVFGRHVRLVAAEIDLGAPNAADAEQRLIVVSDELASSRHVDALGNLFALERTAAEMRRTGRDGLGATITEKMRKIDPEYRAAAGATAGRH